MAFTTYTAMLALGMLITGTMNTISTSWANNQNAVGTEAPSTIWGKLNKEDTDPHAFDHPFFQALCMFTGEFLCVLTHMATKKQRTPTLREIRASEDGLPAPPDNGSWRALENGSLWFIIPACCDMFGTGIMYAGLCLSYASIFQMLRGSVIIFTAVLSCIFLKRKIYSFQWFAVLLVALGTGFVGLASVLNGNSMNGKPQSSVMIGNILIVLAQIIVAIQMCIEEKIITTYKTPALKCVGLEGTFGFCILSVVLVPMYYIRPQGVPIENVPDALSQMANNKTIIVAMLGNILSIALFNFFGLSITTHMSASHRMVLDSIRNLFVWICSLTIGYATGAPGWEHIDWNNPVGFFVQLFGFFLLTIGIGMYNEVIKVSSLFAYPTPEIRRNDKSNSSFIGDEPHGSFLAQMGEQSSTGNLLESNDVR